MWCMDPPFSISDIPVVYNEHLVGCVWRASSRICRAMAICFLPTLQDSD